MLIALAFAEIDSLRYRLAKETKENEIQLFNSNVDS